MNMIHKITRLDETTANQIAAGEVIERPAAVVKELVENAVDARATQIKIRFRHGGKSLIEVIDNGFGIAPDELPLAIERHATSKIPDGDLISIRSFGFRGEALPSIGAVSRLEILSKREGFEASAISVEGGRISPARPSQRNKGTTVTVRDLFFATPARLKFLSSDRSEMMAIGDVVKRLAMGMPQIGFELEELRDDGSTRTILSCAQCADDGFEERIKDVLGKNILENTLPLQANHNGIILHGFVGLPTAAKGSAASQYYFVNERPVRDKLFFGAVKGAYSDLLPSGKFPFIILFMSIEPQDIDVNVHPAKSEIRFHASASVRSFVLNAIRHQIAEAGLRSDSALSQSISQGFSSFPSVSYRPSHGAKQASLGAQFPGLAEAAPEYAPQENTEDPKTVEYPLGAARAQYHDNYIIAETRDGMIIVDQHAAHERLVYERLKNEYAQKRLQSQRLLVPEIISLGAIEREKLLSIATTLTEIGLEIEAFGEDAIAVQSVPLPLIKASPSKIVQTVIDALDESPKEALSKKVDEILASIACHGSVRSGRKLRVEEMNALLREMEATPNSGTCNHGRPTFISLDLKFLEARFGR